MLSRILFGALLLTATAAPSLAGPIISNPGRFDGGNISIQTQSGTSCSSQSPDRASIGVAAGYENNSGGGGFSGGDNSGLSAGVFVAMPLGGETAGNCRLILEIEEQRARLDMAVSLFEAGALDANELREIAEDVKSYIQ